MFLFLYRISLLFYDLAVKLASPVNAKARQFRAGRRGLIGRLAEDMKKRTGKLIWIHAASLGEFEQGRPLIEELKSWNPDIQILLTFFSPSGFEARKDYPLADYIYYLPLDSKSKAKTFTAIVKPDMAIFIKYELWYYYLAALHGQKVPVLIVSAIFRQKQFYFRFYGRFFQKVLQDICHFYVQNEVSGRLLESLGIHQYTLTGDTRFDRVLAVRESGELLPLLQQFKGKESTLILGSVWPSDMELLEPFIRKYTKELKIIIAPHQIDRESMDALTKLPDSVAFTMADQVEVSRYRILILDTMGMLSTAYRYADFAYVGGGRRGALHNTLEAAVYGIPVFFAQHPNNARFIETGALIRSGGAFEVQTFDEFDATFGKLKADNVFYSSTCEASKKYVEAQSGATAKILSDVKKLIETN